MAPRPNYTYFNVIVKLKLGLVNILKFAMFERKCLVYENRNASVFKYMRSGAEATRRQAKPTAENYHLKPIIVELETVTTGSPQFSSPASNYAQQLCLRAPHHYSKRSSDRSYLSSAVQSVV